MGQAQPPRGQIGHTAGRAVKIGVHRIAADPLLDQADHTPPDKISVIDLFQGLKDHRVVGQQKIRSLPDRILDRLVGGIQRHVDLFDLLFPPAH